MLFARLDRNVIAQLWCDRYICLIVFNAILVHATVNSLLWNVQLIRNTVTISIWPQIAHKCVFKRIRGSCYEMRECYFVIPPIGQKCSRESFLNFKRLSNVTLLYVTMKWSRIVTVRAHWNGLLEAKPRSPQVDLHSVDMLDTPAILAVFSSAVIGTSSASGLWSPSEEALVNSFQISFVWRTLILVWFPECSYHVMSVVVDQFLKLSSRDQRSLISACALIFTVLLFQIVHTSDVYDIESSWPEQ